MKFRPILFSGEMVQAILAGRKTQTRRIIKPQPVWDGISCFHISKYGCWKEGRNDRIFSAEDNWPINTGDILWVRETWAPFCLRKDTTNNTAVWCHSDFCYKASPDCMDEMGLGCKWHPSIHMPKEAARIFLRVKDVRVERLKDINEKYEPGPDNPVIKEGLGYLCDFIATWENTIKPADRERYGWDANPWVWVIEFERCEKPEGW